MLKMDSEYRAKFSSTIKQQKWFAELKQQTSVSEVASLCHCSERTVRDWVRAKFLPDYKSLQHMCATFKIPFPSVQRIHRFAHTIDAGRRGGLSTINKYGKVPDLKQSRMPNWRIWWKNKGQYTTKLPIKAISVTKPRESEKLAEFIGIMMGDGTVSNYHFGITLHSIDDKEYGTYVTGLIKNLFHVTPKIYARKNKNAFTITVARKSLVEYLNYLGLPIGDKIKQRLSIPLWIKKNPRYQISCLRGLMDTDGSVFLHRYKSKGKIYGYRKISFSSASLALRKDVHSILKKHKIQSCISHTNVRIDSKKAVSLSTVNSLVQKIQNI